MKYVSITDKPGDLLHLATVAHDPEMRDNAWTMLNSKAQILATPKGVIVAFVSEDDEECWHVHLLDRQFGDISFHTKGNKYHYGVGMQSDREENRSYKEHCTLVYQVLFDIFNFLSEYSLTPPALREALIKNVELSRQLQTDFLR